MRKRVYKTKKRMATSRSHTRLQKESIYSIIKDKIVFLELTPGEFINETKLASDLGVSRTLLREVTQRLVAEGLLVAVPGQGVHVEGIDILQFKNTFEIRESLEGLAGRLAAERARPEELEEIRQLIRKGKAALDARDYRELARLDWRFHTIIGEATRNPKLAQMLLQLLVPFNRLWFIVMSNYGQVGSSTQHWQAVLDALERRSPEETAKALVMHMSMAHTTLLPVLSSSSGPDR